MTYEVVMPRLGWTMEAGTVVEWLKQDGEPVLAGDVIFSVEADKGLTEVEALDDGILHIPENSPLGIEVPVGTILAYIAPLGATLPNSGASSLSRSPHGPIPEPNQSNLVPVTVSRGGRRPGDGPASYRSTWPRFREAGARGGSSSVT